MSDENISLSLGQPSTSYSNEHVQPLFEQSQQNSSMSDRETQRPREQTSIDEALRTSRDSLQAMPDENQCAKDPQGLRVPLMAHQQRALAWLLWREKQKPPGGVLADDMGLGKTLTMISLIMASLKKEDAKSESESDNASGKIGGDGRAERVNGETLVVCPASVIFQWSTEIQKRVRHGILSVEMYHGNNREKVPRRLAKNDVVITTYNLLARDFKVTSSVLHQIEWKRIILDEAHQIRHSEIETSAAVCSLHGLCRWALTGTPIQNKELDLHGLLKFLKCSPFDDLRIWKGLVEDKSKTGQQRLDTVMKSLFLRRTKKELQADGALDLPDKVLEEIFISLDPDEKLIYEKIIKYLPSTGAKINEIWELLQDLQQFCCHPGLIKAKIDRYDLETIGIAEENANIDFISGFEALSLDNNEKPNDLGVDRRVVQNLLISDNPVFDRTRISSKMKTVLKKIKGIVEMGHKAVVVSQWPGMLEVVKTHLDNMKGASCVIITGQVPVEKRQPIADAFNVADSPPNIILLSLEVGGVGLNLTGGNHVLLLNIHWNPQLEAQAQDCVHTIGQQKQVYVYRFICKDTIEERIKTVQEGKLQVAEGLLSRAGTADVEELTLDDLKSLFSFGEF